MIRIAIAPAAFEGIAAFRVDCRAARRPGRRALARVVAAAGGLRDERAPIVLRTSRLRKSLARPRMAGKDSFLGSGSKSSLAAWP
jgi:hypothetical protein